MRAVMRQGILAAVSLALVVIGINTIIAYRNIETIRSESDTISHTQQVITALNSMLVTLDDAETGQRGYILTGRDAYLDPYRGSQDRTDALLLQTQVLTADNPRQQQQITTLRSLARSKYAELARTVALKQSGDGDAALRVVLSDEGRQTMDSIREVIHTMEQEEETLLIQRTRTADASVTSATISLALASVIDVAFLIIIVLLSQRAIRDREKIAEGQIALLEQERTARIVAEAAIRVRDQFLSLAAHELRTPLTSLMGNGQLLQKRAERNGELSDRSRQSLRVINTQAARLNALIAGLLDVSRIQTGQLSIEKARVDLVAITRQIVEETETATDYHTIRGIYWVEPLLMDGDYVRLTQVIQNLVQNAIKYSPGGGTVTVQIDRQDENAVIAVTDEGIGIAADALPRVFERFFRAPNAEPNQISGMGIGLFVVHEIVTLHGGTITVESTEGVGTTFRVIMPLHKEQQ